jgi:hypothetical protein
MHSCVHECNETARDLHLCNDYKRNKARVQVQVGRHASAAKVQGAGAGAFFNCIWISSVDLQAHKETISRGPLKETRRYI